MQKQEPPIIPAPRIERAQAGDIEAMTTLLGELFELERDFSADAERQAAGLRQLLERERDAAVFVARDEAGAVVGMATGQLVISTAEGAASAWIEDVVVRRTSRRRGVGRALIEALLAWARTAGATRAQLLTDNSNAAADAFYRRTGWVKTQLSARRRAIE